VAIKAGADEGGKLTEAERVARDLMRDVVATEKLIGRTVKSVLADQAYLEAKRDVGLALASMQQKLAVQAPKIIELAVRDGDEIAKKFLGQLKYEVTAATLMEPLTDVEAVTAFATDLATSLNNTVSSAQSQIIRTIDVVARRETLRALTRVGERSGSIGERVESGTKILEQEGLSRYVDKAGRRWQLSNYLEMRILTDTRKATTIGAVNRYVTAGVKYVQVSSHASSCPICAPYQGQIMRIGGGSDDNTTGDYIEPPFHPRCRHVLAPYVPELAALFG